MQETAPLRSRLGEKGTAMKCKLSILCVVVLAAAATGLVLAARPNSDASNPVNVRPPHISTDKSFQYDYPIVYVPCAAALSEGVCDSTTSTRRGCIRPTPPAGTASAASRWARRIAGRGGAAESITDPAVSFDGQWVYFAKFHDMGTKARRPT